MTSSNEIFLESVSKAGFRAIELSAPKVDEYLKSRSKMAMREVLASYGIKSYAMNSLDHFSLRSEDQFKAVLKEAERQIELCKYTDTEMFIACPSPLPEGFSRDKVLSKTAEDLKRLADFAKEKGIVVGFEFIGFSNFSVRTVDHAWRIIERVGVDNVKLVIDTFHFYLGQNQVESLERLPVDRLGMVHIDDAVDKPIDQLKDADRLLPGDGVIKLEPIVDKLKKKGYTGCLSVELFTEDYWKQDPLEVAKKAKSSLERFI